MNKSRVLRIATRGSAQAQAQAGAVAQELAKLHRGLNVELVLIETLGDKRADVPLHTMGGQGVFVKEVQRAVLADTADIAVHSARIFLLLLLLLLLPLSLALVLTRALGELIPGRVLRSSRSA